MRKRILFAVILSVLLSFFVGCSKKELPPPPGEVEIPNTENYRVNEDIPCEQYNYNNAIDIDAINLTEVGSKEDNVHYLGVQILSDYETYKAILTKALARHDEHIAKHFKEYIPLISEKVQSAFPDRAITEADFAQYDFLMVDFMRYRAIRLYPRLEDLTREGGTVYITLLYDAFISSTADNAGVLYFIPIPKGCTEAEVTPIQTSFDG